MEQDAGLAQLPTIQEMPSVLSRESKEIKLRLHVLTAAQASAIDRAVQEIGEFGEVRLIISKGHIRFIGKFTTESLAEG